MSRLLVYLLVSTGTAPADPEAQPAKILAIILMVVGTIMLGLILMMSIRSKIAKRNALIPPPRERIDSIKRRAQGREDVHAATADLLDLARRLTSQLEAKRERVEQLIDHADERIALLAAHINAAATATASERNGRVAEEGHAAPAPAPAPETHDEPEAARGAGASGPASGSEDARPAAATSDPLASAVYELADDGRTPVEIARTLDEQIGKVELILALREG